MKDDKHTPGPWKYSDAYHETQVDIREDGGKRIAVAVCDFPRSPATMEANAHLIAAAPELLMVLESIVAEYDGVLPPYSGVITDAVIEIARTIIAKARGTQ